jgi:hypothetical protein
VRFIFDLSAIALPFFLLALAQPHARPAAVLVDELGRRLSKFIGSC